MRLISFLLVLIAGTASAHDYKLGDLMIKHPMAFETVGRTGAGYMEIVNMGADDALILAEAAFPRVELHDTKVDGDVAMMMKQDKIAIPAGETVVFEPRGLHVMVMGLSEPWVVGQEIPMTLTFENAGKIEVVFNIEERPEAGAAMDHSSMDHGEMDHGDDAHAHDHSDKDHGDKDHDHSHDH